MAIDPDDLLICANFHLFKLPNPASIIVWILSFDLNRIALSVSLGGRLYEGDLLKTVVRADF